VAVNGTAIDDDHLTRSRRPEVEDLRTFRRAPEIRYLPARSGCVGSVCWFWSQQPGCGLAIAW
jgi:hypothetical protein